MNLLTTRNNRLKNHLYPLLFEPVLKHYIWGGRNLETLFNRDLPRGPTAESWEIAAHQAGVTRVANGPLSGLKLTELHSQFGLDLIGSNSMWAQSRSRFPLLVKLLDAQRRLSVQVHPPDDYARIHENDELGKSEMWIVLHAEPGSEVVLGVVEGTTPERFREAVIEGDLEKFLHRLSIEPGDFVCVPSGSLHAILGSCVLVEIQQNSNVTYRVYDWGRDEPDRPLHIDAAMQVINFNQVDPPLPEASILPAVGGIRMERLCRSSYFTVERIKLPSGSSFEGSLAGETMEIWGVLEGEAGVSSRSGLLKLRSVQFVLLPAILGDYRLDSENGATLVRTYVEKPDRLSS